MMDNLSKEERNKRHYEIYQTALREYELEVGHSIDNDDYPEYILFAMEKVRVMTKNGEL